MLKDFCWAFISALITKRHDLQPKMDNYIMKSEMLSVQKNLAYPYYMLTRNYEWDLNIGTFLQLCSVLEKSAT